MRVALGFEPGAAGCVTSVIKIGMFIYHHGVDHLPQPVTIPYLAFHKSEIHDSQKRLVSNRTVDARRTVKEIKGLAETAWKYRKERGAAAGAV